MNIEKLKTSFNKYVNTFDTKDKNISLKIFHSFRVMDYCIKIAVANNFTKNEIEIAAVIGLLHDYGRFPQWRDYKTYSDINSVDHAELAIKKLFDENEIEEFNIDKNYYKIIYDAIKYHNKVVIPNDINEESLKFCKLVRDADKLDIFYIFTLDHSCIKEDDEKISIEIENEFYERIPIWIKKIKNDSEHMLLHLTMVFNFEYDFSLKWMKENKCIEKMFLNVERKDKFKKYFDYVINYINERNE